MKEVSEYYDQVHFSDERVPYEDIVEMVLDATGWKRDYTFGKGKRDEQVFRRSIIDLIGTSNGCTLKECAEYSGRDHTTVMKSLNSVENRLDTDMYARKVLREIMDFVRENYKK